MRQNQSQHQKRSRGRGRRNNNGHASFNRNTTFESNGPEGRLRGNAQQLFEKYTALAHDANAAGERISAEAFSQFADHYYRIYQTILQAAEQQKKAHEERRQAQQGDAQTKSDPETGEASPDAGQELAMLVIYQQKQAIMRMALMMRCQKQKKNHRANAPKRWLKIALIHLASLMQKPQRLSHRRTISPVFRVPPRFIRANIPKSVCSNSRGMLAR